MNGTDENKTERDIAVICREVNKTTGEVAVYEVKTGTVDDHLLTMLSIRSRYNPELRYFVTPRIRWESKWGKDYRTILKRKQVTPEAIRLIGGIIEI